jgi:tRNA(fMet)-specific endonuclease VapC
MIIMLASDICRLILRQQPRPLLQQLQAWTVGNREIVVSAVTYAELIAASLLTSDQERHMQLVEAFCSRLDAIVPWDAGAVHSYTTLQKNIMLEQRTLNMNDVMIAAHAISLEATLLSSNTKVFGSISGLDFESWQTADA